MATYQATARLIVVLVQLQLIGRRKMSQMRSRVTYHASYCWIDHGACAITINWRSKNESDAFPWPCS
jgi:hypothetical protein